MSHILIADDEAAIREGFAEYARFVGYEVSEAADGFAAVQMARETAFDLIVLDIMMPRMDGFTACKEIRKTSGVPILMLSARGEEYDKLFGFELGVDDYVTKPFSVREVIARIAAIITRAAENKDPATDADGHEVYEDDALAIDMTARTVTCDGEKAELTPKEYDLLFFLVRNKNIALSRETLLSKVWGYDFFGDDRTVDTHIKTLRARLGRHKEHIVTLRGVGYRFE
ncbi:MAG: response regulator transcription factor [Oscillospiraceae bacterium]|jgi:DNA-binding response OmpR family regulator|nr:response regulator transcription factor [Oscillospiraceae bacterium]